MGNVYDPATTASTTTSTPVPESDLAYGWAAFGENDVVAAVRYDDAVNSMRIGAPDKKPPSQRVWLERRPLGVVPVPMFKVYSSLWDNNTALPAGFTHNYTGSIFYGRVPGIRDVASKI